MGLLGTGHLGGLLGNYDTPIPTEQEQQYQRWLQSLQPQMRNTEDYDLQGAFLAGEGQAGNGHMTDRFKKPNHMTFSNESQYSTPEQPGGQWVGDGNGQYGFWASPANLQNHSIDDLLRYFAKSEPGNQVFMQSNWRLPRK